MLGSIFLDINITKALFESIMASTIDGPKRASVAHATGMSYTELDTFLKAHGFANPGTRISAKAIPALQKWYVNKMRRYVRNALALKLAPDSEESILFFQFCSKYLRQGHQAVLSWDDVDEARLLLDFEDECYADHSCGISIIRGKDNLLDKIHRCFLFSLRLKKAPKHCALQTKTIISFILSNRYHIFTGEADSIQGSTVHLARTPLLVQLNQPGSASQHVFASLAKA